MSNAPEPVTVPVEPAAKRIPWPLVMAFPILIVAGLGLGLSRESRKEAGLYNALQNCDASVVSEKNGVNDAYGIVVFKSHHYKVAEYLSQCEMDPDLGLRIFRRALDGNDKNAKLIALHSAFYLGQSKQLEKVDFDKIVALLKPEQKELDVRRAAQRAISELTLIDGVDSSAKYQTVPDSAKPAPSGEPFNKVLTQMRTPQGAGKSYLAVRWTNADLAWEWWQKHAAQGAWNKDLQRYVISDAEIKSK